MNSDERAAIADEVRRTVRDIPDFPKPGILFRDITPVLANPSLFGKVMMAIASPFEGQGITHVVSIESRGFILGAPVALELRAAFVPVRKPGKLPSTTVHEDYALEYGTNSLEIHKDAIQKGQRVLIVDDLLATGGTAEATAKLASSLGAHIAGLGFVVELEFLKGRDRLKNYDVMSLLRYDK